MGKKAESSDLRMNETMKIVKAERHEANTECRISKNSKIGFHEIKRALNSQN